MSKRIVALICLFLMTVGFVFATGSREEQGKIIIFQSKVEITDALSEAAKRFTEETGIPVEIWESTGDDYRAQLKLKLAGDEVPTIFSVSKGAEADMFKSYLANISSGLIQSYISNPLSLVIDGKEVGVPYNVEGYGLVTNDDLVPESAFNTEEAFIKTLKILASQDLNTLGLSQESYFLIGHILNTPFALMADPFDFIKKYEKGGIRLARLFEFKAFASLLETIRDYSDNPLEINYDRACGDFATGKTAMIHQGNWCYGMFKDYDINFKMSMQPLPLLDNQKLSVSVPYYWVVNSQTTNEAQANSIKFLDWLYTSEVGMDYIVNKFGFVPAVSNISIDKLDPLSASVATAARTGNTLDWTFGLWPMNIIDTDFAPLCQKFFTTPYMSGIDLVNEIDKAYQSRLK